MKAWLSDLPSRERVATPAEANRLRLQREKLFEVIAALTPGFVLRDGGVNPLSDQEVLVVTDDGAIPIEALSQGVSSLIGWVGVLVQRMFDVYHDKSRPWLEPGLVLIDEVDAHMHPRWQRNLAPALRLVFPNLQIIATTHSPLMVPSLTPNQMVLFKRDGAKVKAERYETVMKGYRADQVLTSELFGLESSLSPDTEKALTEYTQLAVREKLKPLEEQRLRDLAAELAVRMPSTQERQGARRAYELLRKAAESHLEAMPLGDRQKMVTEMRAQLQDAITGARRLG